MMRRLSLLLFLCLLYTTPVQQMFHAQPDAPYLYYYSAIRNGFVVERADGTDSRLLGQGIMTGEAHASVVETAWSPSGKWLAWRSMRYWIELTAPFDGWIISADGQRRLMMLDNLGGTIDDMAWSPTQDLLLVTWMDKVPLGGETRQTLYMLINANTGLIVAKIEPPADANLWYGIPAWSADGQYAVVYDSDQEASLGYTPLMIIRSDGKAAERRFKHILDWSSDGYLTYLDFDDRTLIVEQVTTGERRTFPGVDHAQHIAWRPDRQYAFIFADSGLYLLSMQTVRVEKLADKAVDVIDPLWSMVYPNTASSWSPDGQTGIFSLLPEAGGGLYLVTPATSKAVKIEIPGKLLAWQWLNISRQLLIWPSSGATGYRYDLDSTTLSAFKIDLAHSFEQPDTLWGGRLSPDDRLIALFGYERAIFDLTTGAQIRYLPHSATTAGNGGATEYFWHPGSDWLISVESTNPTRSTGDAAGVMRSDGSGRRELGICPGSRSCAGWLPTHVIPYLAPGSSTPVLQEPVETLVHENTVLGAAWSPDGQQIASFTERDQLLHLWQMNIPSGERPGDKIVRGLSPCGEWMAPCHLSWRPDGQELALADGFNKAQIWMLEGNTIALQADDWGLWMPDGSYRVVDVFPSPNGKFLARGKDTIDILDASDRRVLWQFPRSAGNGAAFPTQFAWTPDSRRLVVSGFFDVEPLLWDVEAGQLIPLEQSFPVSDLALSPDGRLLAGISYLAPIHIWDTATGKLLAQLNRCGHAVTFSPDGKRLASAGLRGLYIWDISKPIP